MKKIIALLACIFLFEAYAQAQETIYLNNQKEPIECQVVEINSTEVKYKPADAEQLVVGVNKSEVHKIVFKSGRVQYFTDPLKDFSYYKEQKKWIAKVGILSPVSGFTDFYLEKSLKPGKSLEFQVNITGLGKNVPILGSGIQNGNSNEDIFYDQKGFSAGLGLKVLRMPDFELANRKIMHILQGSYIKPNVILGYYQRNMLYNDPTNNIDKTKVKGVVTALVSITLGKQWILDNTISIDIYALIGLGIDNFRRQQAKTISDAGGIDPYEYNKYLPYRNFGYTRLGRGDEGIAIGAGIKVGYLFHWKKPKKDMVGGMDKMRERLNK
ncbi:MAG: hypothetical protein QM530_06875 [Phycisphaerales bacterium]|nr:hypothetical protein [Phycisphaerales bacterium]